MCVFVGWFYRFEDKLSISTIKNFVYSLSLGILLRFLFVKHTCLVKHYRSHSFLRKSKSLLTWINQHSLWDSILLIRICSVPRSQIIPWIVLLRSCSIWVQKQSWLYFNDRSLSNYKLNLIFRICKYFLRPFFALFFFAKLINIINSWGFLWFYSRINLRKKNSSA